MGAKAVAEYCVLEKVTEIVAIHASSMGVDSFDAMLFTFLPQFQDTQIISLDGGKSQSRSYFR